MKGNWMYNKSPPFHNSFTLSRRAALICHWPKRAAAKREKDTISSDNFITQVAVRPGPSLNHIRYSFLLSETKVILINLLICKMSTPLKYILWYHINWFDGEHTNKEWLRTPPHAPEVPQNQHKLDPGCLRNKMADKRLKLDFNFSQLPPTETDPWNRVNDE